jgi:hypothetical protein
MRDDFIRNHDLGLPPQSPNSGGLLTTILPKVEMLGGEKKIPPTTSNPSQRKKNQI